MEQELYYWGTLRIKNPKTLQKWIDRGWYQRELDAGYIFNVGCGRFKSEKCTCSMCRRKRRPQLQEVLDKYHNSNKN